MYEEYLEKLKTECLLRNRSAKTARTYANCVLSVMKWTGYKPMEELTVEDCREFILQKRQSGTATATCNLYNATLVFLFKWVLKKPWDPERVPRMKVDHKLPEVLTLEEVEVLIDTAKTIRNKALISLMYSSGLRVGELINLRADDIYMSTMQVHIRESKNHCDHWTILSDRSKQLLIEYWKSYPVKRDQFFVGEKEPHRPLTVSGIGTMMKKIARDANIDKPIHPHVLRHSFATHLLENNVPIEMIQAMMGHTCPSTTHVYIHVTNKAIMGIKSPLDHPDVCRKDGERSE